MTVHFKREKVVTIEELLCLVNLFVGTAFYAQQVLVHVFT